MTAFSALLNAAMRGPTGSAPAGTLSRPAAVFIPTPAGDPREIARLDVQPSHSQPKTATVRHLEVTRQTSGGVAREIFDVGLVQDLDTVDLLPYSGDGAARRYYLVRRPFIPLAYGEPADTGWRTTLAGGYVEPRKGQVGIQQAVDVILREKYGLTAAGEPEFNGGPYYPSIGTLAESVHPVAIRVRAPEHAARTRFGSRFLGHIETRGYTGQEIIDGFLRGEIHDLRAVENLLRFSRQRNEDLVVQIPGLPQRQDVTFPAGSSVVPSLSQARAVQLMSGVVEDAAGASISIREAAAPPAQPFIRVESVVVKPLGKDGQLVPGAEPFQAEVVSRKGRDSSDVLCFWFEGSRLKVAVQYGVCPAVWARNTAPHYVADEARLRQLHVTSGSHPEGDTTRQDPTQLVKDIVARKVGLAPCGEPIRVAQVETSPGYGRERVDQWLVPVDPTRCMGTPLDPVYGVDVLDLLALSDQGIVRDPRLSQLGALLKYAYQYWNPEARSLRTTPEEIARFQKLVNQGSLFQAWVERLVPECDDRANQQLLYRRLKAFVENERGITPVQFRHRLDQWFFRAYVAALSVREGENARKWHANLGHDALHHVIGDISPLRLDAHGRVKRDAAGRLELMPFEEYAQLICESECVPAWFSDAKLPLGIGIDATGEFSWRADVARMLQEVAGDDDVKGRAIIRALELDGEVPPELRGREAFQRHRSSIVRYFAYRLMDREQLRTIYDNWAQYAAVGETALRFCWVTNDPAEFRRRIAESVDTIEHYADGVNPFKAAIARLAKFQIPLVALRLAHAIDVLSADPQAGDLVGKLRRFIDGPLHQAHQRLEALLPTIQNQQLTQTNLDIFREYEEIERGVLQRGLQYTDELESIPALQPASGRVFPAFDPLVLAPEREAELFRQAEEHAKMWEQRLFGPASDQAATPS